MKFSIFDEEKLEEFRKENNLQAFRIKQIFHNIFKNSIIDFDDMTDISKDLRALLKKNFYITSIESVEIFEDEKTSKISFKTQKWNVFETVLMFHWSKFLIEENVPKWSTKSLSRITICISSQIWCAVWCKFCVTWKLWFIANLDYKEILEQILFANAYIKKKFWKRQDWTWFKVRNVVFMWMWEPLLNYVNVKKSIEYMLSQSALSLSKRHVTISSSWIVPWIKKLIEDKLDVMLAISLHSAKAETREDIMPITQRYQLDELIEVLDIYVKTTKNRIFYEYIMIKDKTDTIEQAEYLARLLQHRSAHVNLIAYNENPVVDYQTSSPKSMENFRNHLEKYWITVTKRDIMWDDIKWACWQLGYEKVKKHKEWISL